MMMTGRTDGGLLATVVALSGSAMVLFLSYFRSRSIRRAYPVALDSGDRNRADSGDPGSARIQIMTLTSAGCFAAYRDAPNGQARPPFRFSGIGGAGGDPPRGSAGHRGGRC